MSHYKHDCQHCQSLGDLIIERGDYADTYDLYYCDQKGLPTVVARYGNDGPEYTSGINSDHPALVVARTIAEAKGYV